MYNTHTKMFCRQKCETLLWMLGDLQRRDIMPKYMELTALKGLLREKRTTHKKLANIIGMPNHTFAKKINGYDSFNLIEAYKITRYLGINLAKKEEYFFPGT